MFRLKFRLYLVALVIVFLSGVGLFVYHSHVEFQDFMSDHSRQMAQLNTEIPPNPPDDVDSATNEKPEWQTLDKHQWKNYWSNQEPVKVKHARRGKPTDEGVTKVPNESLPKIYSKEDLVPQIVETPDGQVHRMYWYSKLKPGQGVPPPEEWPMDNVIVEGVMYHIPPGETTDSYIEKIELSTIYDVPLNDVNSLIAEGVIPSSLEEAKHDPIFDDPLFTKREDSRPLEASIPWDPAEWGISDHDMKMMTEGIPAITETRMIDGKMMIVEVETGWVLGTSDEGGNMETFSSGEIDTAGDSENKQAPLTNDSDNSLADGFEPQIITNFKEQLTPESLEAELSEGVSPEEFNKAQRLFDQYSIEERLRRLQKLWESDSDAAARQFERERSPKPPRDVPEGEQSEQ